MSNPNPVNPREQRRRGYTSHGYLMLGAWGGSVQPRRLGCGGLDTCKVCKAEQEEHIARKKKLYGDQWTPHGMKAQQHTVRQMTAEDHTRMDIRRDPKWIGW